jgi:4-amino-4-deoxy-L-arabinose transferase-like glycosyltransferase
LRVAALAAAAGGMGLLIAWQVLELVPHVTDSVSYLFQGRILAAGRLYEPPPPLPALFAHENVISIAARPAPPPAAMPAIPRRALLVGRWCSKYPPGWPLLLAIGWWLHAPWLMSPLLLALAVVGVWLAGRRLYDPATGLLAAAALACSPFALLMAGDAMAHVPALCATVWCLAMLAGSVQAARRGEAASGAAPEGAPGRGAVTCFAAGLLGGFALLIRPLTAVALLAPAIAWCAVELGRRRRLAWLAWMALGAVPALVALAGYNAAVFGGPLVSGYEVYEPEIYAHAGAGAVAPWPAALLRHLPWYARHLNQCLWGFPWGDLAVFLPLLWARPRRAEDGMLAACAAALVVAHCFYFYGDVIYSGPRYAFEALGPLALLAARSLRTLHGWLRAAIDRPPLVGQQTTERPVALSQLPPKARRAALLAATGAATCLLLYFPLGRRLPAQILHHAQWYLAQSAAPLHAAARAGVGPDALVFVAGTPWCYSSFFLANDLHPLTGRRVFVRDLPPLRAAALQLYARPEVWVARVVVDIPDPQTNPDVARPIELSWRRLR